MVKKTSISLIIIFSILFIIGIGTIIFAVQQTVFGNIKPIYVPLYGRLECTLASSNVNVLTETISADGKTYSYACGNIRSNFGNSLTPSKGTYHNYCNFKIRFDAPTGVIDELLTRKSIKLEQCNLLGNCETILGYNPLANSFFSVTDADLDTNGDDIIDSRDNSKPVLKITVPKPTLFFKAPITKILIQTNKFYLKDIQGNNLGTTFEQGCNLAQIDERAHVLKNPTVFNSQMGASQVPFGKQINYIWGQTKVIPSNLLTRENADSEDINGDGKPDVYVERIGEYIEIRKTADNTLYADRQNGRKTDSTIECLPANVYTCNSDGTKRKTPSTDVTGQDCSILRGVAGGVFLNKDSDTVCQYECVDKKLEESDCQKKAVCGGEEVYDSDNNQCLTVGTTSPGLLNCREGESLEYNKEGSLICKPFNYIWPIIIKRLTN